MIDKSCKNLFLEGYAFLNLIFYFITILITGFTDDAQVVAVGGEYLRIISWNFVAVGITFTCSSLFQALGNTVPTLIASATRLVTFVLPAVVLSSWVGFELRHLWYLSVVTTTLQTFTAGGFLWLEFRRSRP